MEGLAHPGVELVVADAAPEGGLAVHHRLGLQPRLRGGARWGARGAGLASGARAPATKLACNDGEIYFVNLARESTKNNPEKIIILMHKVKC